MGIVASSSGRGPEHFERRFQRAIYRARRPGAPLALILIDLDSLKNANDTYGHLAGDAVLRTLGTLIREHVRMPHLAGRVGGDEFGIALPDATAEDARALAERLRVVIAAAEIYIATSPDVLRITVSLGIAQLSLEHSQADDLFHAADMALICAKRLGRNRVVSATQSNIPAAKKGAKAAVAELEAEDSEDTRYIWQEVSRIH